MTRFTSLALSAVTALGLAVTPVPAAADGEDIAKALAGLAVLGLIAKTVNDRRDRREAATQSQSNIWIDEPRLGRATDGRLRRIDEPRRNHAKRQGFKKRALPDRCLRIAETGGRDRLVYVERCLQRNYKHADKLPGACERLIRTPRGLRTVYGARCLRRDGWKVASR